MSVDILMPALSPTMEEGTLSKWLVKEGDKVESGDLIAEIETDKATMEVEAIDDGIIGKILVSEGQESIKVNSPIAILLSEGENLSENVISTDSNKETKKEVQKNKENVVQINDIKNNDEISKSISDNTTKSYFKPDKLERIFVSPLAKRIAKQRDIPLNSIKGSGPHGRILKIDVDNFDIKKIEYPSLTNLESNNFEIVKNSAMRKTIAERLVKSKNEAPHFYLSLDCNIDELLKVRKTINSKSNDEYKISVNDMIIKASSAALLKVPKANASWENENTKYFNNTDISVAVAIEGGLITPIVKNVQSKGLLEISMDMKDLAKKAKDGKLTIEDLQGGTFTISNGGVYGSMLSTPILNLPQSGVLGMHNIVDRPVVIDGEVKIRPIMYLALSYDHRIIDGKESVSFLKMIKENLEDPRRLFLNI